MSTAGNIARYSHLVLGIVGGMVIDRVRGARRIKKARLCGRAFFGILCEKGYSRDPIDFSTASRISPDLINSFMAV